MKTDVSSLLEYCFVHVQLVNIKNGKSVCPACRLMVLNIL